MKRYCGQCGSPLREDAAFCGRCGSPAKSVPLPNPKSHRAGAFKKKRWIPLLCLAASVAGCCLLIWVIRQNKSTVIPEETQSVSASTQAASEAASQDADGKESCDAADAWVSTPLSASEEEPALLPPEIMEGSRLKYELMQYEIM